MPFRHLLVGDTGRYVPSKGPCLSPEWRWYRGFRNSESSWKKWNLWRFEERDGISLEEKGKRSARGPFTW